MDLTVLVGLPSNSLLCLRESEGILRKLESRVSDGQRLGGRGHSAGPPVIFSSHTVSGQQPPLQLLDNQVSAVFWKSQRSAHEHPLARTRF